MCEHTMRALLKEGAALLEKNGIGEAGLDAWLLMEYVTGKNRTYYFAHMEEAVPREQEQRYRELLTGAGSTFRCSISPIRHFLWDMRFL